jgi:hypothetical protein
VTLARPASGARALDIGAGAGKATMPIARTGLPVTALGEETIQDTEHGTNCEGIRVAADEDRTNDADGARRLNRLVRVLEGKRPVLYDVGWRRGPRAFLVGEVKSFTSESVVQQIRLGLGQVLEYAQRMDPKTTSRTFRDARLVLEKEPHGAGGWTSANLQWPSHITTPRTTGGESNTTSLDATDQPGLRPDAAYKIAQQQLIERCGLPPSNRRARTVIACH